MFLVLTIKVRSAYRKLQTLARISNMFITVLLIIVTGLRGCWLYIELGGTQNLKTVQYFIKYHGTNNYHGI